MNIFELKIWDDESKHCTFYTVQWSEAKVNETDKFFSKYEKDTEFGNAVQELLSFILYTIGEDHGALDVFFNRFENEVTGLPVKGKVRLGEVSYHFPNFPLRLYALRVTEKIVILFNGGVKDGPTNQKSSLNSNWMEACQFAKRILDAINSKEILIDEHNRILTNHLGNDEIIL